MTGVKPVWTLRHRFLLAVPGLVPPLVLLGVCLYWLVSEFDSLHINDFGGYLLSIGISAALLLCLPPLLVALPRRLRPWHCLIALVLQFFGLYLGGVTYGVFGVAVLAYVPALVAYRLLRQRTGRNADMHLTSTSSRPARGL
jgi:hypothetical protein